MGTITINYSEKTDFINIARNLERSCTTASNIIIEINRETSLYVEITTSDSFGETAVSETITSSKAYSLVIRGFQDSNTSMNNTTSYITIKVKADDLDEDVLDSLTITRTHNGVLC